MSQRSKKELNGEAPAVLPDLRADTPHVIHPTGVYLVEDVKRILKLKDSTVRREVREKRLRIAKRAGRYYLLGEWLLQWLRDGELRRQRPAIPAGNGIEEA